MKKQKYKGEAEVTRAGRLREARRRHFDSIEAAAQAHGWSKATLNAHERGARAFKRERAEEYALAFDVDIDWLWKGPEAKVPSPDPSLVHSCENLIAQEHELALHLQRAIEVAARLRETTKAMTDLILWAD